MYPGVGLYLGVYLGDLVHVSRSRIVSWSLVYVYSRRIVSWRSSSCIQEQDCILEIQFMYPGVGLYPGVQYMYTAVGLYPRYLVYVSRSRIVFWRYSLCIQEQDFILVIQFLYPGVGFILDIQFVYPYLGLYPEDLVHVSQRMIPNINQIY